MWDASQFPRLPEVLELQFALWSALFIGPVRYGCVELLVKLRFYI